MKEIETLQQLGLSEKEAQLYLKLLTIGSASAGELIKELKFYSKTVYELLEKLIEKGLVSYVVKSNVKYFEAADPERLSEILSEQQNELEQKNRLLREIIPILKKQRKLGKEPQEATIYKGKQGMKSIFEDALKQQGEILVFGGGGKFKETLGPYAELWHKKRVKAKIPMRILWSEKHKTKIKEAESYEKVKVKLLPKEFENPAPVMIYGEKVAITVWSETPLATLIRSKEVAKSYQSYFNILWRWAK